MNAIAAFFKRMQRTLRDGRLLGDKALAAFLVDRREWPGNYRLAPNDCVL